jgi:hypothetical protein
VETPIDLADIAPEESPVLDALEQFAQFVDEIYDSPKPSSIAWEGNPSRVAVRSVGRVLCKWRHAIKPNRPPNALVVRLARRLPTVLTEVANHPKRVLQRRRAMEPINRLRELDSTCVRWLVRQPGNTVAEKSGHRRAVLAVQRFESVDTMENRVVRDLLKRCSTLANAYLKQNRSKFPDHDWIRMTDEFLKLCRRLESLPHLQEVSGLPSMPKPNYVLLHETRYKQIWRSYMEVIRQQRRRQQLWTYRHQAYADMVTIAWMNSASLAAIDRASRKAAHRFDLRIRETPLRGTFFDWSAAPPTWGQGPKSGFFIGPATMASDLANCLGFTSPLATKSRNNLSNSASTAVVSWNNQNLKSSLVKVGFSLPENDGNACSDQENQACVTLSLVDSTSGDQQRQQIVPVALIEHPTELNRLHREWCQS